MRTNFLRTQRPIAESIAMLMMTVAIGLTCSACLQPNFDIKTVLAKMPKRAPEMDRLEMLAGEWTTQGNVKMMGLKDTMKTKGQNSATWECDGRFLVERSHFDFGELGPMSGMSIWTWDGDIGKYRMWWFDGFGETATGTATFDEKSDIWHIKTKGKNGWCSIISKGTIKKIDEQTLEWTWDQWDGWHIFRIGEMRGLSKRKS